MADNNEAGPPKLSQREAQEALEKQVASLKREIGKINKVLAARAEEAVNEASGWYDSATDRASRATQQLKSQAQSVSEAVRENPGTVSTAMVIGGAIGLLIGLAIGQSNNRSQRWF